MRYNRIMDIRMCAFCGKPFIRRPSNAQRFCTPECCKAERKRAKVFECKVCGKSFHSLAKSPKYCGVACMGISYRSRPTFNCIRCQAPFRSTNPNPKYCSAKCKNEASRKHPPRANPPVPRIKKPVVIREKRLHGPGWKGGKYVSKGYVNVFVGGGKYRLEHRLVMETVLGRPLGRSEHVHHKNGIRHDNRPENLEVLSIGDHTRLHRKITPHRIASCHPDQPHASHGLCKRCYARMKAPIYRARHPERARESQMRYKAKKHALDPLRRTGPLRGEETYGGRCREH
jgi:hypothetical protein